MLIKLLPSQVPMLWDAIKYAAVKSRNMSDSDRPAYLTQLIHDLLSGKSACFVRLNEKRELLMVHVSHIVIESATGRRTLSIGFIYSFQRVPIEQWKEDFEILKEFARKNGCRKLVGSFVRNKRVLEIADQLGFTTPSVNVEMEV